MNMIKCINCDSSIPNDSQFCPFCGQKITYKSVEVQSGCANDIAMPADPTNIEAVLKRAFIFLEDGLFDKADRYLEIVLDQDPENAKAYIGKLLVSVQLQKPEQLAESREDFENNSNYKKALRYADEDVKHVLIEYAENSKSFREKNRVDSIYTSSCKSMEVADDPDELYKIVDDLKEISGYKNSEELIETCYARANDMLYEEACSLLNAHDIASIEYAVTLFEEIIDWKDAKDRIEQCKNKISQIKIEAEKKISEGEKLRQEVQAAEEKKVQRIVIVIAVSLCFVLFATFVGYPFISALFGWYTPYINMYHVEEFEIPEFQIPDGKPYISPVQFKNCPSLESITVPDGITSISGGAFCYCINLTSISVDENNVHYKSMDGNLYSKDGLTLIQYCLGKGEETFTIPNGVKRIDSGAFEGCFSLTTVVIPDGMTSIDFRAFRGCSNLTSVIIPKSVVDIHSEAFRDCPNLKVYYLGTEEEWDEINIGFFNGISENEDIVYNYIPEE